MAETLWSFGASFCHIAPEGHGHVESVVVG